MHDGIMLSTPFQIVGYFAFVLGLLTLLFVYCTAYIFWRFRDYAIFRFRWPLSYLIWSISVSLYIVSRMLYFFGIMHFTSYEFIEDSPHATALSILRILGLHGGYMVYLCRMWLFHYVYALDHAILSRKTDSKFVRYINTFGNERFMLGFVFSIFFILCVVVILDDIDVVEIHFATQIYYGILGTLFLGMAVYIIPTKHDQLGLKLEYVLYVALCIVGFIGLVVLQLAADGNVDHKRVLSYLGAVCMLFLGNLVSFYITMFHYNGYKHVFKAANGDEEKTTNSSDIELATVLLERTFDTFRSFLAQLLCVENLDFVVIVQQFRQLVLADLPRSPYASRYSRAPSIHQSRASTPSTPSVGTTLAGHSSLRKSASQKQVISTLLVFHPQTNRYVLDITKLSFEFVPISQELSEEASLKKWFIYIYEKYIHKDGECSLNLPSSMRSDFARDYHEMLEGNAFDEEQMDQDTATLVSSFFNEAQMEVWGLMASDSMMHFSTSPLMKQCMWKSIAADSMSSLPTP